MHPDPVSLFNYRKDGHYTPEGNLIVAKAVLDYLAQDGFVPQQLKLPTESVVSDAHILGAAPRL